MKSILLALTLFALPALCLAEVPPPPPAPADTAVEVEVEAEEMTESTSEMEPELEAEAETTEPEPGGNPMVVLSTTKGDIVVELFAEEAPISVENFLAYVKDGHYDGTIFHRVIDGFMVQGGGFTEDMQQKPTKAPIKNEATNGLKNERGTPAMARTGIIDSATSQFFINVVDNAFLDHRSPDPRGFGYCVFGKVVEGMDVVDAIKGVATGNRMGMQDVPVETVTIDSAKVLEG